MEIRIFFAFVIYLVLVSLVSMIVTVTDKVKAIRHRWRIPESTLLLLSAAGGSLAMLLTMLVIRHKTRHIKFMLGIPIIMLFQGIVLWYIFIFRGLLPFPG